MDIHCISVSYGFCMQQNDVFAVRQHNFIAVVRFSVGTDNIILVCVGIVCKTLCIHNYHIICKDTEIVALRVGKLQYSIICIEIMDRGAFKLGIALRMRNISKGTAQLLAVCIYKHRFCHIVLRQRTAELCCHDLHIGTGSNCAGSLQAAVGEICFIFRVAVAEINLLVDKTHKELTACLCAYCGNRAISVDG